MSRVQRTLLVLAGVVIGALVGTDLSGATHGPITWVGIGAVVVIALMAWGAAGAS